MADSSFSVTGRNSLQSQSLDLLRFPLAVIIVMLHIFSSNGITIQGIEYNFDAFPAWKVVNDFIDGFFRGQIVPIYYFISGFVFFWGVEFSKNVYVRKLKNRVKTLLVPYIIWNTFAILVQLVKYLPCFAVIFPNYGSQYLNFSFEAIVSTYWNANNGIFAAAHSIDAEPFAYTHPMDVPLWFVRDLMIVVLCVPLLYYLIKKFGYYFIILLGGIWFAIGYSELGRFNQLLSAFFFFSWGAYFSINQKDMIAIFGRYFKWSIVVYPLLGLLYVAAVQFFPDWGGTINRLDVLAGLIFTYNLAVWLLQKGICKVNGFLASSSFFLYVSHAIICQIILKSLFYIVLPQSTWGLVGVYTSALAVTVGLLLLSFYLMRQYTPGLLKVVAGRK